MVVEGLRGDGQNVSAVFFEGAFVGDIKLHYKARHRQRPLCHGFALSVYQNFSFGGVWIAVLSLHCEMTGLGGCETCTNPSPDRIGGLHSVSQKVGWKSADIGRSRPRNQRHGCSRHGFDTGSGASNRSMTQGRPNHGPSGRPVQPRPPASPCRGCVGRCQSVPEKGKLVDSAIDRLRQTRGC